jgi:hypothetical protein
MISLLRRFDIFTYKNKNGTTDTAQIPTAATVTIYRQGATVTSNFTVTSGNIGPYSVAVANTAEIQAGDTVQVGTDPAKGFTVDSVPDSTHISLLNDLALSTTVFAASRLVVTSPLPSIYDNAPGTSTTSNPITADSSTGRAQVYVRNKRFDYIVSGTVSPSRLFIDAEGGSIPETYVNVLDFPTFQAAHDALPSNGGTIFVPAGTYNSSTIPAFTGLVITKLVSVLGEANGPASALSLILHDMSNAHNIDVIFVNIGGGCALKNLFIQGPNVAGSGRGVRWYKAGSGGMAGLTLDNVTVWRSSNLAFEFICDGYETSYVSKLEMLQCTAYEALSGGSLFIGGAGSNNNYFERCEFSGSGFGGFNNVVDCTVTNNSTTVTAADLSSVNSGDEVSGMGIAAGTTVVSVNTGVHDNEMVLSKNAIGTPFLPTVLTFYRASGPSGSQYPRGHVHLMRTSISLFSHCAFQGPGTSPAITADLVSNDLVLRDCYRESPAGATVHSFIMNGMYGLLIDGLFHQFVGANSRLLKTGLAGLFIGRISNAFLVTAQNPLASTDVVELSNTFDELMIDNSFELGTNGKRDIVVKFPAGAGLPEIDTTGSLGTITLPNGSDEIFRITGTTTITTITALRPKRRVTLVFASTAQLTDGSNLKLTANFTGGADRTITLVCDGTNWFEVSRSIN